MNDRYLPNVIEQMMKVIPETEIEIRDRFNYIFNTAVYTAPEMMRDLWFMGSKILEEFLPQDPNDCNDWQRRIVEIWNPEFVFDNV